MSLFTRVLPWSLLVSAATGCIASKESLGSDGMSGDDDDAGDGPATGTSDEGGHDGVSGHSPAGTTDDEGSDTIDHAACYPAVLEACNSGEGWSYEEPACIAAVSSCFPLGTDAFGVDDMISVCSAEIEETCLILDDEGCSQTFCECTIGVYPFDWSNCWNVLFVACNPFQDNDCVGPLAGCYPDATVEEYQACREVVSRDDDCICSSCGAQVQCEAALAECLGA
jgi:hypothetical protein